MLLLPEQANRYNWLSFPRSVMTLGSGAIFVKIKTFKHIYSNECIYCRYSSINSRIFLGFRSKSEKRNNPCFFYVSSKAHLSNEDILN